MPILTLEAPLMDLSILTDEPCPAPCWYSLELNKSTKLDVINTLQTLSFVDANTVQEHPYGYWDHLTDKNLEATLISVDCIEPQQQCVGLTIANDSLKGIGLFPNYLLTLSDVVNSLGPPDFVRAVILQNKMDCKIILTWMDRQIMMEHDEHLGKELCNTVNAGNHLNANLRIHRIYYELPEKFTYESQNGEVWPGLGVP